MSNNFDTPAPPKVEEPRREDSYFEKLIRYIPLDIIAAYQAIDGIIRDQGSNPLWLYWAAFLGLLVLTPLYTIYRPNQPPSLLYPKTRFCAIVSTISFSVWVFALGGPFEIQWPELYRPVYGSVLLILTALTLPVLEKIILGRAHPFWKTPTEIADANGKNSDDSSSTETGTTSHSGNGEPDSSDSKNGGE